MAELADLLKRLLALLPKRGQRLIREHVWEGKPLAAIASQHGLTRQAMDHRWKRALWRLRQMAAEEKACQASL